MQIHFPLSHTTQIRRTWGTLFGLRGLPLYHYLSILPKLARIAIHTCISQKYQREQVQRLSFAALRQEFSRVRDCSCQRRRGCCVWRRQIYLCLLVAHASRKVAICSRHTHLHNHHNVLSAIAPTKDYVSHLSLSLQWIWIPLPAAVLWAVYHPGKEYLFLKRHFPHLMFVKHSWQD